jgi:hypothetical protein
MARQGDRDKQLRLHLACSVFFMRYTLASMRPQSGLPTSCEHSKCS